MRLLLSSYYYPPSIGGVEHQSHLLARGLTKRGHSVRVISARLPGFKTDEELDGVHIHRVSAGRGSRWQKMATYLAGMLTATIRWSGWADVIQVQQILYPAAAVASLAPILRRPLVVRNAGSGEFGGVQLMRRVPLGRLGLNVIARGATGVSLNPEMTTEMRTVGFRRMAEIPNGVDLPAPVTAQARRDARQKLGVDGLIVLYAGRLEAEKGVDLLIRAWESLHDPAATLLLVGDGPEREMLQRIATTGMHSNSIIFTGPTHDVKRYYQTADLFVLPSRSEGISTALLEAMACGVSVIATDVGGNRAVVHGPDVGTLVPPLNPQALAGTIERVLRDSRLRSATGSAGRARVEAVYSAGQMVQRYEQLYRNLTRQVACSRHR